MSEPAGTSYRFPRRHRLKRRLLLTPLFRRSDARTLAEGSIRLLYRIVPRTEVPGGSPVQVAFIPGRRSSAVARNRIRRTLREVYRLHQQGLVDLFSRSEEALTLAIVYRGPEEKPFPAVARNLPRLLDRLAASLHTEDSRNRPPDAA